jgi:hypothetical protein
MRKFAPGRNKGSLFWQAVVEQDGELLGLKRMKRRLRVWSGPPLKASAREPADAEPWADAVEHQDFEGRAAPISKNEDRAIVRIGMELIAAQ